MGYELPAGPVPVSCDWACHRSRNPPSSEPGTDYACGYGTPLAAADTGTVTDVKSSSSSATGRYVTIALVDGRTVRYLHLSEVWVVRGQAVTRGQMVGLSGASGNGSDRYYGPHVHVTLWPGAIWAQPTIDFQLYVGDEEEDDLDANDKKILGEIHQAIYTTPTEPGGWAGLAFTLGDVQQTGGETHQAIYTTPQQPGGWDGIAKQLGEVHDATVPEPVKGSRLEAPAWVAVAFIALIGIVEIVRFVVDLVT